MQRHGWEKDVIWFLTVHLCPIGPRVLDTCSLNSHTIRMWDHESPKPYLESYLIPWGHKVVWGFIIILYLCHSLLLYLRLRVERLYCLGKWNVSAVSTSPVTLSGSQSFTTIDTNLWVRLGAGQPRRGLLSGVAP